jgi:hypothetical protein
LSKLLLAFNLRKPQLPFYELGCTDRSLEVEAKLFSPILRRESVPKSLTATTPADFSDRTPSLRFPEGVRGALRKACQQPKKDFM